MRYTQVCYLPELKDKHFSEKQQVYNLQCSANDT